MVSRWHPILCELGYPQLDVVEYSDGEWSLIEYLNAPLIPSLTRWHVVMSGLRNVEITRSFLKHLIERIDLTKETTWQRLREEEQARLAHDEALENARVDAAMQTAAALTKNDTFMEKLAQEGAGAFNLDNLLRGMSASQQRGVLGGRRQIFS
jgi:hypothetical protein